MSVEGLNQAVEKMRAHGMNEVSIASFSRLYHSWESDASGWIKESDVAPLTDIQNIQDVMGAIDRCQATDALAHTAFLKLNGGLGTSMGLSQAKSLLPVRVHKGRKLRFLDIILGQVMSARKRLGIRLPIVFMDSYRTSKDTMDIIKTTKGFEQKDIPVEILQNREPKILPDGTPASWDANPDLEWCPPGHGDLFPALAASRLLDKLQENGVKYLFISNSDNLGARPSTTVAGYFAQSSAPFMMEVARRTPSDVKGGQIVRDCATGRLMLREMSQVQPEDMKSAMNIERHAYFNTNNLWARVDALKEKLDSNEGILPLPVITNHKTVDPTDPASDAVIQLETAMGAAIGQFDGSICLEVGRPRFLPVKTTNDLFIMRSDRFHMTDSFEMEDSNYVFPVINLDKRYYKNIADFDARFPYGIPSIAAANSVSVTGDWTFGKNITFFGDAALSDGGKAAYVPQGQFVGPNGIEDDDWE